MLEGIYVKLLFIISGNSVEVWGPVLFKPGMGGLPPLFTFLPLGGSPYGIDP